MNGVIQRMPQAAAQERYDVIVVGGGLYGACVALVAARRGLRCLLLEKHDFGAGATANHFRLVRGGFQTLPSLRIDRLRRSIRRQGWFLSCFGDLVEPTGCLMPLDGRGLRHRALMTAFLSAHHRLLKQQAAAMPALHSLARGRILGLSETIEQYPGVDSRALEGSVLWYEARVVRPQRLMMETLHWADHEGAVLLNYVEAVGLLRYDRRITAVRAVDHVAGESLEFRTKAVVNCAGQACGDVAERFDRRRGRLNRRVLAYSVLLDLPPPAPWLIALPARRGGSPYMLAPLGNCTVAGVAYRGADSSDARPDLVDLDERLHDLNRAVPSLRLRLRNVRGIQAGLLPAAAGSTPRPAAQPLLLDHGSRNGPVDLYSLVGAEFAAAPEAAAAVVQRLLGGRPTEGAPPLARPTTMQWAPSAEMLLGGSADPATQAAVAGLAASESVVHLEDLVLRRLDGAIASTDIQRLGQYVCEMLDWPPQRRQAELARLRRAVPADPLHRSGTRIVRAAHGPALA